MDWPITITGRIEMPGGKDAPADLVLMSQAGVEGWTVSQPVITGNTFVMTITYTKKPVAPRIGDVLVMSANDPAGYDIATLRGQPHEAELTSDRTRRRPRETGGAFVVRAEFRGPGSGLAAHDRLLDLGDRLRHLDAAGAGVGAVEGRAAAPHALLVVEDVEAHLRRCRRASRR